MNSKILESLKSKKMKNLINILFIGLMAFAISCASPENPTSTQTLTGEWYVEEYYVNGQSNGSSIIERFFLERDGSFLLEDFNNVVVVGSWTSTESTLTLTSTDQDATVYQFNLVFVGPEKMQIVQNIENPSVGDLEIRYLMNRTDERYY